MGEKHKIKIYGTTSVGPKGQVVLPKSVRELIGLNPKDKVIIVVKDDKFIGIVKSDDLKDLIEYAKAEGVNID